MPPRFFLTAKARRAPSSFGLQAVDHTLDAGLHQRGIPVEQETKAAITQLQMGQQLSLMNGQKPFHCLVFDDNTTLYKGINPVASIDLLSILDNRHYYFTLSTQASLAQFIGQTLLVG
jgi:hypothetical protein